MQKVISMYTIFALVVGFLYVQISCAYNPDSVIPLFYCSREGGNNHINITRGLGWDVIQAVFDKSCDKYLYAYVAEPEDEIRQIRNEADWRIFVRELAMRYRSGHRSLLLHINLR